jgi:hypothetical protein
MRVVGMVIKMMKEEVCDLLKIPVDQVGSSRLITTIHVCICSFYVEGNRGKKFPQLIFHDLNRYLTTKDLEYVVVIDARMHLDILSIVYCVMISYGIITGLIQETYSFYNNEYPYRQSCVR